MAYVQSRWVTVFYDLGIASLLVSEIKKANASAIIVKIEYQEEFVDFKIQELTI